MDFFITDTRNTVLLDHSYSPSLVVLSFLVATSGSVLALYVATASPHIQSERTRQVLLWAGASAFGLAVWSMHFIGMLAFSVCTTVSYNTTITVLSAIPAILAGRLVLRCITRNQTSAKRRLFGGTVTGAGIGVMHYSGMMAIQTSAALRFDPLDFAISIAAAVLLATLALWSRTGLIQSFKLNSVHANRLSAIIMGLAITSMHYSGMTATRFIGSPETSSPVPPTDWYYLTALILMGMISMLGLVASGVLLTKLRESVAELKVQDFELKAIIENSTEAIVTTHANGMIKSANHAFEKIFSYQIGDIVNEHISTFLPQWSTLLQQEAQQLEYETLGKRKDGLEFPIRLTLTRLESDFLALYLGFISDLSNAKRIQEKLIHDANHDFLTGLYNRRFFENQFQLEFNRSERSKTPVSLIILDIDHFKRINDTFGHLVGDRVLEFLASMLKESSRSGDIVARFGGEEFLILLPNTDLTVAKTIAERLRAETEKLELTSIGKRIKFTISIGVTCLMTARRVTPETLTKEADQALYRAKNSGRNRVEVFSHHGLPELETESLGA